MAWVVRTPGTLKPKGVFWKACVSFQEATKEKKHRIVSRKTPKTLAQKALDAIGVVESFRCLAGHAFGFEVSGSFSARKTIVGSIRAEKTRTI